MQYHKACKKTKYRTAVLKKYPNGSLTKNCEGKFGFDYGTGKFLWALYNTAFDVWKTVYNEEQNNEI